jgi:hypothetical protein
MAGRRGRRPRSRVASVIARRRHADDPEDRHERQYRLGAGNRAQQTGFVVTCSKPLAQEAESGEAQQREQEPDDGSKDSCASSQFLDPVSSCCRSWSNSSRVTTGRRPPLRHVAGVDRGMSRRWCCARVPFRHTSSRRRCSYARRAWRRTAAMSQGSPEGGTEQGRTTHAWPFGSPVISTMSQLRTRNSRMSWCTALRSAKDSGCPALTWHRPPHIPLLPPLPEPSLAPPPLLVAPSLPIPRSPPVAGAAALVARCRIL